MRQIVILSGKGGTGKTTVAAALAHLASQEASVVLADADVDAANLELVLSPRLQEEGEFTGGGVAVIDRELCIACGQCHDVCRFEAILDDTGVYAVDEIDKAAVLVFDAAGELVFSGDAEAVADGQWQATLGSDLTGSLSAGSNQLAVIVVSKRALVPVRETLQFVTQ